jgi:hypothetical protein
MTLKGEAKRAYMRAYRRRKLGLSPDAILPGRWPGPPHDTALGYKQIQNLPAQAKKLVKKADNKLPK